MAESKTKGTAGEAGGAAEVKTSGPAAEPAVVCKGLNFRYGSKGAFGTEEPLALDNISLTLPRGARCLLVGDNGAGKTTLLRVLGGKHFIRDDQVRILGRRCDFDRELNHLRSYLGGDWGKRTVAFVGFGVQMTADIPAGEMMPKLQAAYPERRKRLYELLDINPQWRMHKVSDGQRRRAQLLLKLLRPSQLLLIDEVTTDLDLVARRNLLNFLQEESEQRGVTIIYATHILDGLEDWATNLVFLTEGSMKVESSLAELPELNALREKRTPAPLLRLVETWLRAEFEKRRAFLAANPVKKVETWGHGERTVNTGFSRGSVIPTPNLNIGEPQEERKKTQAQIDREKWQLEHTGTATVSTDEGEGAFMPVPHGGTRLGFNKTNSLNAR